MKIEPTPIIVIGGGPSGLMAAEILASSGRKVRVYDHKPSVARKFLMAGRGGLNLTHSEVLPLFLERYGAAQSFLSTAIDTFPPSALRQWCEGLGQETFIGSSGRVFPKTMKASPLLRAWLARLESLGVEFRTGHRWTGWDDNGALLFTRPDEAVETVAQAPATLLALGGGSWPNLGSDGGWVDILRQNGVPVTSLRPANCGFVVSWSDIFKNKFAGQPLKNIALTAAGKMVMGEMMIAQNGIEGGAVYALSSLIRDEIEANGTCTVKIDLLKNISADEITAKLKTVPRGRQSFSTYLQKVMGLSPLGINLLREADINVAAYSNEALARLIKSVPLVATATFSMARAISTAGGIPISCLTDNYMIEQKPGVFAAGEMLDWEAPTGGYLLQASFASGVAAAKGMLNWLDTK